MLPPKDQKIDNRIIKQLKTKIENNTFNVAILNPEIITAKNGGEYIVLRILPTSQTLAHTSDGRYYFRDGDETKPIYANDMHNFLQEKGSLNWELQTNLRVESTFYDQEKASAFVSAIQSSDRVSKFVKQKSFDELLEHYHLSKNNLLTNFGVLMLGTRNDRARLFYPPRIQFIRYDSTGQKIRKVVVDDMSLNPSEMLYEIYNLQDWNEGIEISAGLFRNFIPSFNKEIIRELVTNSLIHRSYTLNGDIFINMYPDRLVIISPGALPLGVTPKNIIHKSVPRNQFLAELFRDMKLMEKEGSGYDTVYELLLSDAKPTPKIITSDDAVEVTVFNSVQSKEVINLIDKVKREYSDLSTKEIIVLGLIAQHNALTSLEISQILNLNIQDESAVLWIGKLLTYGIVLTKGRTRAMTYFINPQILKQANYRGRTNLRTIEDHRLKELILTDIKRVPGSSISQIQKRIGEELPKSHIRRQITTLLQDKTIYKEGERRHTKYFPEKKHRKT